MPRTKIPVRTLLCTILDRIEWGRLIGQVESDAVGVYTSRFDFSSARRAGSSFAKPVSPMIEALKSDEIVIKLGGRFKLTALIQRRLRELIIDGARPLIERSGRTDLELVIEEILQGKIAPDFSETGYVQRAPQKKR